MVPRPARGCISPCGSAERLLAGLIRVVHDLAAVEPRRVHVCRRAGMAEVTAGAAPLMNSRGPSLTLLRR